MSKQYNIRWRRSDTSKLVHLIKKVNKKIFEIEVKRPDIAGLQPAMLDYQELKSQIQTRNDYKNLVNKYKRYLKEGAEEVVKSDRGAVATKWKRNEMYIEQRADNIRKKKELHQMGTQPVTIAGKDTGVKRAEMKSTRQNALNQSNRLFKNMSQKEFDNAIRLLDAKMFSSYKTKEMNRHMRNYVKGLIAEGYSDELLNVLEKIPPEVFQRVFYTDEVATYDFIYDPLDLKAKQEQLLELWQQYVDEETQNTFDYKTIETEIQTEYDNGERIKGTGRIRTKRKRRKR